MKSADIRKAMYKSVEMEVPANANILAKIESKGYYIFTLTSKLDNIVIEIQDGRITKYTSKRSVEGGYIVLSEEFNDDSECVFLGITGLNLTGFKMYSEIKYGYIAEFFSPYTIENDGTFTYISAELGTAEKHDIKEGTWVSTFRTDNTLLSKNLINMAAGSNDISIDRDCININGKGTDGIKLNASDIKLSGRTILTEKYSNNGVQYSAHTVLTPGKILMETTDPDRGLIETTGAYYKTIIQNGITGLVSQGNMPFEIGVSNNGASWDINALKLYSFNGISLGIKDSSGTFTEYMSVGSSFGGNTITLTAPTTISTLIAKKSKISSLTFGSGNAFSNGSCNIGIGTSLISSDSIFKYRITRSTSDGKLYIGTKSTPFADITTKYYALYDGNALNIISEDTDRYGYYVFVNTPITLSEGHTVLFVKRTFYDNITTANYGINMGAFSLIVGYNNITIGEYSTALGSRNIARRDSSLICGEYARTLNSTIFAVGTGSSNTRLNSIEVDDDDTVIIGHGQKEGICKIYSKNGLQVGYNSYPSVLNVYGEGRFTGMLYCKDAKVNSADYAEYFEWSDSNPNDEDRVGYFVSLNPERKIQVSGTNILGIVSATPGVIGNAPQEWPKKYLLDEWGREIIDETTGLPKLNPEYDETQTYIPRSERKEWSPVGMLGMLRVRDDGTCKVGGYCKPNEKGIATAAESGYYITNRYSKNIIEVFLK